MLIGTEILTTAQMRAIESAAIDSGSVTGLALMERAGAAVAGLIRLRWPRPGRVTVLCGPGNNGGDGFVIARLLHHAGWTLRVLGMDNEPGADAAAMKRQWLEIGPIRPLDMRSHDDGRPGPGISGASQTTQCDILVDALLGTGGSRPLPAAWAAHLADAAERGTPIVAVDVLSGLDLDTGRYRTEGEDHDRVRATVTITFQRAKLGHKLEDGPARSGDLVVADIGLEQPLRRHFDGPTGSHEPVPAYRLTAPLPALAKSSGHKFDHGHALVLAGTAGRGGAARLAARAALRCGAGMVTLACPTDALSENAAALPDAIMLRALDGPDDLRTLLADRRINAICAGPGLGVERAAQLLPALVRHATDPQHSMRLGSQTFKYDLPFRRGRNMVLDADALTAGAQDPQTFLAALHVDTVLTPHDGEFARLFPDLAARLTQRDGDLSRLDAARDAADRAKAVVLLKGPTTVIAANAPRLRGEPPVAGWLNAAAGADAVPWLATAGAGDVLAGIITGLMARGLAPHDAAATGAWLHAAAARRFGPGLIADDLPDQIPGVFRDLGL